MSDAAVNTFSANVDFVVAVSIVLVGTATLVLAYILISCRQSGQLAEVGMEVRADSAMDEASGAKDELGDSSSHGFGIDRPAGLGASSPGSTTAHVAVGASSSGSRDGLFRRPLAHSQRHDSSSTLPMSSSMRATSVTSSSGRSFADSASLPSARRTSSTWGTFTTQHPFEEDTELTRRSQPPVSRTTPQRQQQPQLQVQDMGGASGDSPTLQQQSPDSAGRLFVPTWGLPPHRPLQAVSAPLTGLALSSSGSQGDQLLPSVQSLSDPTVSAVRTPTRPPAQLPASALLQEAFHAAGQPQGGTGTGLGAISGNKKASRPGPPAAGTGGAGAVGAACSSSSKGQQQGSAAAPSLDLASVLTPGTAGPSAAAVHGLLPPGAAAGAGYSPAASLPHVRPIGTCLPAAPWSVPGANAGAGAGGNASSLLYGAAPPRPLPTNSLYKSPLQHVTLSVKVPIQFTPTAASNLQSLVARQVWAGESRLEGPTGEPRDPQHTIMHMVSVPGCIQLFLTVAQWHPEQGPATAGPQTAPAWGPDSVQHHLMAGQQDSAGPGAAADVQAGSETEAWFQAGEGVLTGAPAPEWLVEAVCKAVEDFCRAHPTPEASTANAPGSSSNSAGPQADSSAQQQHYTGPVLLHVNGVVHMLKPNAADPGAAWVLQECSAQELAELQAGPHLASAPTAAAAAAHAAHPPVVWQASRGQAVAAATAAPVPASPVLETPATSAARAGVQSPLTQLQQSARSSSEGTPSVRSASTTPAAARTFIRTVAHGVVSMHEQGSAGLFAPPDDAGAASSPAPAASGVLGAGAAGTGREGSVLASSSLAQPSPVFSLNTSCAPATALPPGMWAWPLYLAATGQGTATADVRIAVCGSSAAVPWVSLHGLPGRSCRVVVATSGGAVLMDKRVMLENGVARFLAPESSTVKAAKIFYMLPPASASGTAGPSTPIPPQPSASTGSPSAAGPAAAPADQLLCMLPLLYLPPDAVIELCEAARALMLERSNYLFTQQLQQQREEREREQAQREGLSGSTMEEESYAVGSGLSGDAHIGTLSMTGAAVGAGDLFSTGVQAGASATDRAGVGPSAPSAAAAAHLGTPAERNQAAAGTTSHEGSFDTQSPSPVSQAPRVRSAGTGSPSGVAGADPVAAAAATGQARAAAAGPNCGPSQLPAQHASSRPSSSDNRRSSSESAVTAGNGSSGSSSMYDSKTGLEDEPGQLNLRGRLFEGATDVHQLLNSQYLAILADLGLLIELAPEEPAAGAVGGITSSGSSTGGGAGAPQHISMATDVGQQLLVWFMDNRCWNCCQLVLQLLVRLGINIHVHGQPVASASITSAAAVQQLLQSAAAAGAATPSAAHAAAVSLLPIPQADMIVPTPISGISRAGVWGHLPPEFPATAMQSPQHQVGQSRMSFARQPSAESPHFGFARPGVGSSSGAGVAGHAAPDGLLASTLPAVGTAPHVHHAHTSSTSTSASYHSLSSAGPAAEPLPEESDLPAPQALRASKAPIVWPPYKPTVFTPTVAAAAAARVAEEQQIGVGVLAASEGEGQPSGSGSRGSLRLSGMLDSASEMWTRLRRNRSKGKREEQQ